MLGGGGGGGGEEMPLLIVLFAGLLNCSGDKFVVFDGDGSFIAPAAFFVGDAEAAPKALEEEGAFFTGGNSLV